MAEADIVPGNGIQVLEGLTVLRRYEGKRAKLDVSMDNSDNVLIYLNAASAKQQPRLRAEDVSAMEAIGFVQREDDGYTVFVLR